jgi:hypothetical protein
VNGLHLLVLLYNAANCHRCFEIFSPATHIPQSIYTSDYPNEVNQEKRTDDERQVTEPNQFNVRACRGLGPSHNQQHRSAPKCNERNAADARYGAAIENQPTE